MVINFGQLKSKTIVITGASSGIGKETAITLGKLGANLVLGGRREKELGDLASAIDSPTLPISVDVTKPASVRAFAMSAIDRFGAVDALINCAGTGKFDDFLTMSTEDFTRMLNVNVTGTFLVSQTFAKHMVQHHKGAIINVGSIAGTTALAGCAGYSASKFGVLGLTRVMQLELRRLGIHVTAMLPGAAATPFWDGMESKPDAANMIPASSIAKHIAYILCQPEGSVIDEIMIMPPLGIL